MFSALRRSLRYESSVASISRNLVAGLTTGVIALPLSMALAIASGVAPQHGLYTAMIAGIVIGISGGSKVNISGPTAAFVVILLPIVQQYGLGGLLVAGLMAGFILLAMGFLKLGNLIEMIPYPVIVGFTAGIGVVIATLQIKDFLGLDVASLDGHFAHKFTLILSALPSIQWNETLVGAITLAVLILWPRIHCRIPGHIVALMLGTGLSLILTHIEANWSVETLGSRFHWQVGNISGSGIPPYLPDFNLPWNLPDANGTALGLEFDLIQKLIPAAFAIAMLGALESLLCAVVADGMSGKKHDPNDELIGQGLGNIVAPFFSAIPATAAIARTAANVRAGASSPVASITHGLFILLSISTLAPILAYIPISAMAALLMMVAWNMSEARHFLQTLRIAPRDDVIVLLTCFSLTVLFDMTIAVAAGMGLAAVLFIRRSIDTTAAQPVDEEHDNEPTLHWLRIYDINGPLFFGSAQKAISQIADVCPETRVVILNMARVNLIDMTAIVAMKSITAQLRAQRIHLIVCNLKLHLRLKLRRAGLGQYPTHITYTRNLMHSQQVANRFINHFA